MKKIVNKISPRIIRQHIVVENHGKNTMITYFSPKHPNDRKRIGQELTINVGNASLVLKGNAIRSLRNVLKNIRKEEKKA
jgi:hypothetical protein